MLASTMTELLLELELPVPDDKNRLDLIVTLAGATPFMTEQERVFLRGYLSGIAERRGVPQVAAARGK